MGKVTNTAIIAAIKRSKESDVIVLDYLDELAFLAKTAGIETKKMVVQAMDRPNAKHFLGKGKLESVAEYVKSNDIDHLIFDDELSPSQLSNIEKVVKIKVLDRSDLILLIFQMRAKTAQAKLQVELAQMQYTLPRLKRMWTHLERQRGGTSTRGGAGEKEIETDRRNIRKRIGQHKQKLEALDSQSQLRRKKRSDYIRVALVGYTNVGKTTIMNLLSKSEQVAADKLFATLDTTVRKMVLDRTPFLLSDTVGFIRKLPHHLIESFKTTLAEAKEADILIHVVDCSHEQFEEQIKVVKGTLKELGVQAARNILVFNKIDAYYLKQRKDFDPFLEKKQLEEVFNQWSKQYEEKVMFISATEKENINKLREFLLKWVKELYQIKYPYKTDFF